jgi:hypothetical protein
MPANQQKTPLARSLNQFAERKVVGYIQLLGKALPAQVTAVSGSIVTVKFLLTNVPYTLQPVTVPLAGPEYSRPPTQIGDNGVVFPSDVYLGGVSGLGGGVADLTIRANLSALVFFPIGNTGFSPTDDPNAFVLYGPDGCILRTMDKSSSVVISKAGTAIKIPVGGALNVSTIPTSSSGNSGDVWSNGGVLNVVP